MSDLAIIIVNWNTGHLLSDCLTSLVSYSPPSTIREIVVVDSASSDDSLTQAQNRLASMNPSMPVSWLAQPTNVGFARGNNIGIEHCQKKYVANLPHVLLLNPDTVVLPGSLEKLLASLDQHPNAGIVGPRLQNPDSLHQPSVRAFPNLIDILILLLKLPRLWPKTGEWRHYLQLDFNYDNEQPADQVMGAAFLIRNSLLIPNQEKTVGLLDENFFVWFEEVDYCLRAKKAGWEIWYIPQANIIHYGGISFNQLIGWSRVKPWLNSTLYYTRKHLGAAAYIIVLISSPLALLLSWPASIYHRQLKRKNTRLKA